MDVHGTMLRERGTWPCSTFSVDKGSTIYMISYDIFRDVLCMLCVGGGVWVGLVEVRCGKSKSLVVFVVMKLSNDDT